MNLEALTHWLGILILLWFVGAGLILQVSRWYVTRVIFNAQFGSYPKALGERFDLLFSIWSAVLWTSTLALLILVVGVGPREWRG